MALKLEPEMSADRNTFTCPLCFQWLYLSGREPWLRRERPELCTIYISSGRIRGRLSSNPRSVDVNHGPNDTAAGNEHRHCDVSSPFAIVYLFALRLKTPPPCRSPPPPRPATAMMPASENGPSLVPATMERQFRMLGMLQRFSCVA